MVQVRVDRDRSHIDNKPPGSYTYTRGTTLRGFIKIVNTGTEIARARALVYDEANREEIWVSDAADLYPNQVIQGDFTVTVDKDRRITMYAQYYDAIRDSWRTYDIYGSWDLEFREMPMPTEKPKFEFLTFEVPPAAEPGDTITVNATVVNRGGSGECEVVLGYYDTDFSDQKVERVVIPSGGRYSTSMDITIPEDYKQTYLNVYGELYGIEPRERTDRQFTQVRVIQPTPEQPPTEQPPERPPEEPVEPGNVVVSAVAERLPFRGVYVAFYKGKKKLKEKTLKSVGDKLNVEVSEKTHLVFYAKKPLSLFASSREGVAEVGEHASVAGFRYFIKLRNFNVGGGD